LYPNMLASLHLYPSRFSVSLVTILGLALFLPLILLEFHALRPLYTNIDNPYFLLIYLTIAGISGSFLYHYNRRKADEIIEDWHSNEFTAALSPMELLYLKTGKIEQVIHGVVNQLILDGKVRLNNDETLSVSERSNLDSAAELTVINAIQLYQKITYHELLMKLKAKPVFEKTINVVTAFKNHINQSKEFVHLFLLNLSLILGCLSLGFTRVATGYAREKPILLICMVMIILTIASAYYLFKLIPLVKTVFLDTFYSSHSLSQRAATGSWEWNYLLLGSAFYSSSFEPLARKDNRQSYFGDSGSDAGSSSDGGDAGSCGSSCGGCGGGGD
jgi:uncharacterized membrane protein YgcG